VRSENEATIRDGGGVYELAVSAYYNCIVWGNIRHDYHNQPATYPDQILDGLGATTITFSDVQGGWSGTGNINADPLFFGNYKLQSTSPCKDVGDNAALPLDSGDLDWDGNTSETLPKDLAMQLRVRNFTVDMGAFEQFGFGGGGEN